jgi:hypothetical protein
VEDIIEDSVDRERRMSVMMLNIAQPDWGKLHTISGYRPVRLAI